MEGLRVQSRDVSFKYSRNVHNALALVSSLSWLREGRGSGRRAERGREAGLRPVSRVGEGREGGGKEGGSIIPRTASRGRSPTSSQSTVNRRYR